MSILTHTIAAISTPPGKGGVAIIRISGDEAINIAERVFTPISKKRITDYPERTQIYGHIKDGEEILDDVLLTYFKAPRSYTGEEVVEIGCHGGILLTHTILELILSRGAVLAEAGEFTRRAFINGRLTLTEAEAVGNLLEARSREQIRLASEGSRRALDRAIESIRERLVRLMSSIYARIDYPDEDLSELSTPEIRSELCLAREAITALLSTYPTGKAISEGIRTVICGKPNAGKSSLYNLLLGEDKAIVTDIEGTTRDVLESTVPLGRVMLNIADTAGIRSDIDLDTVERIGIEKSRKMIEECELLFAIFDISRPLDKKDEELLSLIKDSGAVKLALLNKADEETKLDASVLEGAFDRIITLSVKEEGAAAVAALREAVDGLFTDERLVTGQHAVLSSARQRASLIRGGEFIDAAIGAIDLGFCEDAISGDIERAIGAVSEPTGRTVSEDIVADIFARFCVGK